MENEYFQKKYIIDNFILPWLRNVFAEERQALYNLDHLEEFYHLLLFPPLKGSELLLRSLIDHIFLRVPSSFRLRVTGFIKRLRNPQRTLKLRYPLNERFNRYLFHLKQELGNNGFFWEGKQAAFCLSHDVDTREGYRFLPALMRVDQDYGIPSVINVLTHGDYSLDKELLSELIWEGFEIGLHGYRHELGLARKSYNRIKTEIESSLSFLWSLGVEVKGFRAPGFSISDAVLSVLEDLGFRYDSSMQLCNGLYHSCGLSFPYIYPGKNYWEIPLAVQDDLFFRDARVEEKEVLRILEKILLQTIKLGGMVFLNFHPCLLKDRIGFYKRFLEMLISYKESLWMVLPGELCQWLDQQRGSTQ